MPNKFLICILDAKDDIRYNILQTNFKDKLDAMLRRGVVFDNVASSYVMPEENPQQANKLTQETNSISNQQEREHQFLGYVDTLLVNGTSGIGDK